MLKLKNICKYYKIGKTKKIVLDNINLEFNTRELVFILGSSGSGKSTLVNIIGGNLKSDSGEIWLDNICLSKLKEKTLDKYRSSIIGNVFQDYNLIDYMCVVDNIILGLTETVDRVKLNNLLKQLKIYEKRKISVNKLSGGEKQRVAIARALINNPDIILADEPTGALDSKTSIEVMDILKEISKEKLVIVVSHDNYLANKYATRIINIKDGKCDYLPVINNNQQFSKIKNNKIKYKSIIKLSIKNLWCKKARTIFTSVAITLGIISMALVANLYSNFSYEINNLEEEIAEVFPIIINNGEYEIQNTKTKKSQDKIIIKNKIDYIHKNNITNEYIDYLNNIKEIKYLTYTYDISFPLISDKYQIINNKYFEMIPSYTYIEDNYNIIYGRNIQNKFEILLKVDSNNNVDDELLKYFDIYKDIDYEEMIGRKVKVILNNDYYIKDNNYYKINNNNSYLYQNSQVQLSIVGIIKEKNKINDNNYLYYDKEIIDIVLKENKNSNIVKSQIDLSTNIFGLNLDKEYTLSYLGYNTVPTSISIYVNNLKDKENVINKLDEYNKNNTKLIYTDTMAESINIVREFILIISIILIVFSLIAITISSLMIFILTNTRVLEQKKEIGILRSLGASKKDIRKLFNTENIIIGMTSSLISLITVIILVKPINSIMNKYLSLENIFNIKYNIILIVFIINIIIIKISGSIPARKASKMEIVNCIYNR